MKKVLTILMGLVGAVRADLNIKQLYLVDMPKKSFVEGDAVLPFPNRVYARYNKENKIWQYLLTDTDGKFPKDESLVVGTVLPGAYLGTTEMKSRYILGEDGRWGSTKKDLIRRIYIATAPAKYREISYQAFDGKIPRARR